MSYDFERNLITGRIAEQIFELMFRNKFEVFRNGYENAKEFLAQHVNEFNDIARRVLLPIRHAPDFIVVTRDKSSAYLVEVKFRSVPNTEELLGIAKQVQRYSRGAHVFLATPLGFHMAPAADVIAAHGEVAAMSESWLDTATQVKYLKLLRDSLGLQG